MFTALAGETVIRCELSVPPAETNINFHSKITDEGLVHRPHSLSSPSLADPLAFILSFFQAKVLGYVL